MPEQLLSHTPLTVAIPDLNLPRDSGIGRVLHSLIAQWGAAVRAAPARLVGLPLPVIRNLSHRVEFAPGEQPDLVLLPRLTGAQALRATGGIPSIAVVYDTGVVDCRADLELNDRLTMMIIRRGFYGLRYATRIIAISEFTRCRLVELLPQITGRVHAIPLGVDKLFAQYDTAQIEARRIIEAHLGRSLGSPLLLYVGSELPRKNVVTLLEAFRMIRQDHPNAVLLKVGRAGHQRWRACTLNYLRQCGLQADKDVVFVEGFDDVMLAHGYGAADVFISASLYEGFGLPALEAMAVGTPVVVSDRGAHPEVVADGGMVVAPTAAALAAAVETALADRRIFGAAGKRRAAWFRWRTTADAYLDLMHDLVQTHVPSQLQ